jgi:hypothetical protein
MKMLVVYNCCGAKKDNLSMWIEHIDSLILQKNCIFDLVISGCIIDNKSQIDLLTYLSKTNFKGNIFLDFIQELHPVNVTFNHSIIKCSENFDYRGYLFLSSDIKLLKDDHIQKMFDFHINENVGISNFIVDNENWIPTHISQDFWNELQKNHTNFPFGQSINCDCMIFDGDIFKTYGKVIPDIFRSWCTESVFPFLSASINKSHKCHDSSIVVHHAIYRREGSSVIAQSGCEKGCDDLYRSKRNVRERLLTQEAYESGFGYAESHFTIHKWTRESREKIYLIHNDDFYFSPYHPKDTNRLVSFIKNNVFLSDEELNYNDIPHLFQKI